MLYVALIAFLYYVPGLVTALMVRPKTVGVGRTLWLAVLIPWMCLTEQLGQLLEAVGLTRPGLRLRRHSERVYGAHMRDLIV